MTGFTSVEQFALFTDYFEKIDLTADPVLIPGEDEIQAALLAGQLPLPVRLEVLGKNGDLFRIDTTITRVQPAFPLSQSRLFFDRFTFSYAADGLSFERIFDVYPRLGGEISATVADFVDFSVTEGSIFAYIREILASTDPSKAIQLDFPGDTVESAFFLPITATDSFSVTGQAFSVAGAIDTDIYSFSLDQVANLDIMLPPPQWIGAPFSSAVFNLFDSSRSPIVSTPKDDSSSATFGPLEPGLYYIEVAAVEGSNFDYEFELDLQISSIEPPEPPEQPDPLDLSSSTAQLLYVAYYGRPADFEGLQFWQGKIADAGFDYSPLSGDFLAEDERPFYDALTGAFGSGVEYVQLFGDSSNVQKIDAIYQNSFGRNSEVDPELGFNYWVGKLNRDEITLSQAAVEVALGAQAEDRVILGNRIQSANVFLQQLDTMEERAAYSGEQAANLARTWLQSYNSMAATSDEADAIIAEIVVLSTQL